MEKFTKNSEPGTKLPCPICRAEFLIPSGGVSGLRKNFFVEKIKYIRELSAPLEESSNLCDACSSGGIEMRGKLATMYCVDCQEEMCEECSGYHRRMKMTRQHTQVQFGDRSMLTEQLRLKYPPLKCEKHTDEVLKVYCLQCKVALCMMCYIMEHKTHDCSDVSVVADEFRSKMKADVSALDDSVKKYRKMLVEVNEEKEHYVKNIDQIENEVCLRAERLKALVDQDKAKVLDELETLKKERLKQVDNTVYEMEQHTSTVESLKMYVHELTTSATASEITREEGILRVRTDELFKSDTIDNLVTQLSSVRVVFKESDVLTETGSNVVGSVSSENYVIQTAGKYSSQVQLIIQFSFFLVI